MVGGWWCGGISYHAVIVQFVCDAYARKIKSVGWVEGNARHKLL